jgi:hypothetical protein
MDARLNPRPGLEFLFVEIRTGMTFARIARDALPFENEKAERNRGNARKAYDTVLKFRGRVKMNSAANKALDAGLDELRTSLRTLGEPV